MTVQRREGSGSRTGSLSEGIEKHSESGHVVVKYFQHGFLMH